jgi:hypothetical protein
MSKAITAALLLFMSLLLASCMVNNYEGFVSGLQDLGPNPYISEPELQDLEQRIRTIAMAEPSQGGPYALTFDPRNNAIISNFQDRFSKQEMMEAISLARAGYSSVVAARYPHIDSQTECTLVASGAYIVHKDVAPDQFDWTFIKGRCVDGLAHGVGKAVDQKLNAHFVGRFEQGVMVEGVFTMPLKGKHVIQQGEVPGKDRIARLLMTEIREDGFQWHGYGDFNDRAEIHGFGVVILGYTNKMVVNYIGEFKSARLNGFAVKQAFRPWKEGKVWNVWLGHFVDGKMNGAGAWTNGRSALNVGYRKDGKRNGKAYGEYSSSFDNNETYAGTYLDGNRDGVFTVRRQAMAGGRTGEFTEIYANGQLIDDGIETSGDDDFGKFVALAAGAAVIGSSGISDTSKADIASAFAADVLTGGDGKNMNAMQQQTAEGTDTGSQTASSGDKGIFRLSCYAPGTFICVDYTLNSRSKSEQIKAQCSQGGNKLIPSCDSSTRQAICRHQSEIGETDTHDYLYGSEPEQVKEACLSTGGQFRMIE